MRINSEISYFRPNPSPLLWDATWIDPALRRMAEEAAARSGLTVEEWLERAIRKTCCAAVVNVAEEPAPIARSATGVLTRAKFDAAREPVRLPRIEAERRHPAAVPAQRQPAPRRRTPPAPIVAIAARSRQKPQLSPSRNPWRRIPLYAAASMAVVLLVIAVIAASQPRLRLGANDQDARTNPCARYGANPRAVLTSAKRSSILAMIAPAVRPYFHDRAIATARVPTKVGAAPSASVAIATTPVACTTQAVMSEAAAPVATRPRPIVMVALHPQSSGAAIVVPLPFASAQGPSFVNPGTVAKAIRASIAGSTASLIEDAIAPALDAEPEGNHPRLTAIATQTAMAEIGALPAPTIVPASPGGPGGGAQISAELDAKANAGDPIAEFRLGIIYAVGKGVTRDYSHAASLLRASGEAGLAEAQYDYGMMCGKGLGVARDASEAARWYAKAAQQGYAPAALNLGYAYAQGLGVVRNLPEAARWFGHAADAGQVNAQYNLAYMYEQGAGVAESKIEAYAWYSVAAAKGDQRAQQGMARIAAKLTAHELQLAATRIGAMKRSFTVPN